MELKTTVALTAIPPRREDSITLNLTGESQRYHGAATVLRINSLTNSAIANVP